MYTCNLQYYEALLGPTVTVTLEYIYSIQMLIS